MAQASLVTFNGTDVGVGPGGATPNASAAAASFDTAAAAIAAEGIITFESAPVGTFTSLSVAPGVTVSGSAYNGAQQSINNSPDLPGFPALDGFNTTTGGSNYLEMLGGTATFTFATPTQYFGAYFTGVQSTFITSTITFSDGTSQSVNITNPDPAAGGVTFTGFTDAGKSISSITINAGVGSPADFIGVDDVRYQTASAAVPEPATVATGALAVLGFGLVIWKQRKAVA
jgi:hypothetical protein